MYNFIYTNSEICIKKNSRSLFCPCIFIYSFFKVFFFLCRPLPQKKATTFSGGRGSPPPPTRGTAMPKMSKFSVSLSMRHRMFSQKFSQSCFAVFTSLFSSLVCLKILFIIVKSLKKLQFESDEKVSIVPSDSCKI